MNGLTLGERFFGRWEKGEVTWTYGKDESSFQPVLLDTSHLNADGSGTADAYYRGGKPCFNCSNGCIENDAGGLRVKHTLTALVSAVNVLGAMILVPYLGIAGLIPFKWSSFVIVSCATSYMGVSVIYNVFRTALMPLYVLARAPFNKKFTAKLAGQEFVRSFTGIFKPLVFAPIMAVGALYGLLAPFQGRKVVAWAERNWNGKYNGEYKKLSHALWLSSRMEGFQTCGDEPSSHTYFQNGCFKIAFRVTFTAKGVIQDVQLGPGFLHITARNLTYTTRER